MSAFRGDTCLEATRRHACMLYNACAQCAVSHALARTYHEGGGDGEDGGVPDEAGPPADRGRRGGAAEAGDDAGRGGADGEAGH